MVGVAARDARYSYFGINNNAGRSDYDVMAGLVYMCRRRLSSLVFPTLFWSLYYEFFCPGIHEACWQPRLQLTSI